MPLYFSPVGNDQTFDANGDPLTGGQIETYIAGSSTPLATFTDDTGSTPQSNPIILNSLGYPTLGAVWLTGGQSYKFVIKDAMGVTLRTIDNISGVNDASVSQSEWVVSGLTPTYINATSFSVPGDQTTVFQINRRLRTTNTSGFIYSTITDSVFAAGITTVTVANDSGVLDAGLSVVEYALLSADNDSVPAIGVSRFTMSADKILGRTASGTGPVQELTRADLLAFLGIEDGDLSQVGDVKYVGSTTAPTGWIKANGQTIGSSSSGATALANAFAEPLFTYLWNNFGNTVLVIQTSAGSNTTRGASAAADFAANKRMPLLDLRAEFIRGLDDSRGIDSGRALGSSQAGQMPAHTHTVPVTLNTTLGAFGSPASASQANDFNATSGSAGGTGNSSENRPRNVALLAVIKL
jgi:hypothetical protein